MEEQQVTKQHHSELHECLLFLGSFDYATQCDSLNALITQNLHTYQPKVGNLQCDGEEELCTQRLETHTSSNPTLAEQDATSFFKYVYFISFHRINSWDCKFSQCCIIKIESGSKLPNANFSYTNWQFHAQISSLTQPPPPPPPNSAGPSSPINSTNIQPTSYIICIYQSLFASVLVLSVCQKLGVPSLGNQVTVVTV